jgi:hypothetical protein
VAFVSLSFRLQWRGPRRFLTGFPQLTDILERAANYHGAGRAVKPGRRRAAGFFE